MYQKKQTLLKVASCLITLSSFSLAEGFLDNFQGTWGVGASVLNGNYENEDTKTTLSPYIFGSFGDLQIEANRLLYPLYSNPSYTLFAVGNYRSHQYSQEFNKDRSIELGLTIDIPTNYGFSTRLSAFQDISDKHNGYELEAQIYRGYRIGQLSVLTALSVQYQDESLTNYYYGTTTYKADAGEVLEAELILTYPIGNFDIFSGFRAYSYGKNIKNSPISSSDNIILGFGGLGYKF